LHNPIRSPKKRRPPDILSDGRLEFGVGRGVAYQYRGYGIPQEESREALRGALDFILQAWDQRDFFLRRKHFRSNDLSVVTETLATPHPPVRSPPTVPDTFPFSGRRKFPIFASPLINPRTN